MHSHFVGALESIVIILQLFILNKDFISISSLFTVNLWKHLFCVGFSWPALEHRYFVLFYYLSCFLILTQGYVFIYLFFRFYLFIFRERGGREKERERNIEVWEKHQLAVSCGPPTGDLACNPGMCPDWESNHWPFGSQADTESTEPHQPRLDFF